MEAHIPLKGRGEVRGRRPLAARKRLDPSIYRLRGVVEGVFGALKTRLAGGYLQEVLPQMAQKRAYLEAAAYNLRAALRLLLPLLLPPLPPYLPPSKGPFARQAQGRTPEIRDGVTHRWLPSSGHKGHRAARAERRILSSFGALPLPDRQALGMAEPLTDTCPTF